MKRLDEVLNDLNAIVKRRLKVNPGLEAVIATRQYKKMVISLSAEMREQVYHVFDSGVLDVIDSRIGGVAKASERIESESDELEIQDAVVEHMKPVSDETARAFSDFLILVFNMGGQDFLNKHNIPKTFELTNKEIIKGVDTTAKTVLKDIDETTTKWIRDQISSGRSAGLSNSQIVDQISDAVPKTYANRAERIVFTETSSMVGRSEHEAAKRNGAAHKEWVTVGDSTVCPICESNEEVGFIGFDQKFPSGDLHEPAHPNCRCLVEYQFSPAMGFAWAGG